MTIRTIKTPSRSWRSIDGNKCNLRKANKEHECKECEASILPNEEYLEVTFMGDDFEYHTIRICKNCMYRN
jgi:hypothetical protein